jgi:predicted ATPase
VAAAGLRAQAEVARLQDEHARLSRIGELLTTIGEQAQESAQRQIEELVTRGLQVIFDETLSFHVIQSVKANASSVEFVIRTTLPDGQQVDTGVMEARGGGMVVVVSFMLRLVVLLLTPGIRRLLVLDEAFSHVSREYETRLAEFLREACDKTGLQIIMNTHSDAYSDLADQRYRLVSTGTITAIEGLTEDQLI